MKYAIIALLALLLMPFAAAEPLHGSIKLLALSEAGLNTTGTVADLELELLPGRERVFLETYPLTKLSTQVSMRMAQQIACKELDLDCSKLDFLYTIKAAPGIVGGPSAGSAAAVITGVMLLGLKQRNDIAITGTINSGGIIGPVGAVIDKIEAASSKGIKTVLIPKGERIVKAGGKTVDLAEYGRTLGVDVFEVSTLKEALAYFEGYRQKKVLANFSFPKYEEIMGLNTNTTCARTLELMQSNITVEEASRLYKKAFEVMNLSPYSAASYCFRANTLLHAKINGMKNLSLNESFASLSVLNASLREFETQLKQRKIATITDLQAYMSVSERLNEVRESIGVLANSTKAFPVELAYAEERFFSAKVWANFFNGNDSTAVSPAKLMNACNTRIAEAEERYSYVTTYVPTGLGGPRKDIDDAYNFLGAGSFAECIYSAGKAKASIDVVLGLLGADEERIVSIIDLKLGIVAEELSDAAGKGILPIISYSYYEYAKSLKDTDKANALIFAEYALEFSSMDVYLDSGSTPSTLPSIMNYTPWIALAAGIIIGLVVGVFLRKKEPSGSFSETLANPSRKKGLRGKKR